MVVVAVVRGERVESVPFVFRVRSVSQVPFPDVGRGVSRPPEGRGQRLLAGEQAVLVVDTSVRVRVPPREELPTIGAADRAGGVGVVQADT